MTEKKSSSQKPSSRKRFLLTTAEYERLEEVAARRGTSLSGALRWIVEGFLAVGSDLFGEEPGVRVVVQMNAPQDMIEQAMKKATRENNADLLDVIRHELAQL